MSEEESETANEKGESENLRRHHKHCEDRYEKILLNTTQKEKSDEPIIPELKRTDSVILDRNSSEWDKFEKKATKHKKKSNKQLQDDNHVADKMEMLYREKISCSQPRPQKRKRKAALKRPKEAQTPEKEEIWSTSEDSQEEYVPEKSEMYSEDSEESEDEKMLHSQQKRGLHKKKAAKRPKELSPNVQKPEKELIKQVQCSNSEDSQEEDSEDGKVTNKTKEFVKGIQEVPDPKNMKVKKLEKKKDGSRLYDKHFYCYYCKKPVSKMARHLKSMHFSEVEVEKAFAFPKGSRERRMQLSFLLNKGNRLHNNLVLKDGIGTVIPRRQPSQTAKPSDFVHCVNCQGYYKRSCLWRHMKRCQLSQRVKGMKEGTRGVLALCKYMEPVPDHVNEQFWKMLQDMRDDEISAVVRREKYILKLGESLFNKSGHDKAQHEYIRQKMRESGRMVLEGQKNGHLKTLTDFFVPANFHYVITAVRNVAGQNKTTNSFKTPTIALKLGHNLKKIANIMECDAMITGDEVLKNNTCAFKKLYHTKWNECVSSQALRNLEEGKWNAPLLLPVVDDIVKMHNHLDVKREELQAKLTEPNRDSWAALAKITLCEIILFNRRRAGEVSKMPLNAFIPRDNTSPNSDVLLALSDLEKKLCSHFKRIEIRGKRGRKVPLLLTPNMCRSMEMLLDARQSCDVLDENVYMFAKPKTKDSFYRGSDAIRQVAQSCGANNPAALSSTKLRKHVATMSKVLNLKDNEMDELASFLGHDIRVHREYYRLPEGTLQLAKISKVLMALERGSISKYKGKNLDEIQIDPQEKVIEETESESESVDGPCSSKSSERSCRSRATTSTSLDEDSQTSTFQEPSSRPSTSSDLSFPEDSEMSHSEESKGPKGRKQVQKRPWTTKEIEAVEKTLFDFIQTGKVPGKAQCTHCIESSAQDLEGRTWQGVKFYVKNRIEALRRASCIRK